MYRIAPQLRKVPRNGRGNSTNTKPSGSGGKPLAVGAVIVVGGAAASLAAASVFPGFRKTIEQNIPPVKYLLNPVLGPLERQGQDSATGIASTRKQKNVDDFLESTMKEARKKEEAALTRGFEPSSVVNEEQTNSVVGEGNTVTNLPEEGNNNVVLTLPPPLPEYSEYPTHDTSIVESKKDDSTVEQSTEMSSKDLEQAVPAEAEIAILSQKDLELELGSRSKESGSSGSSSSLTTRTPEEVESSLVKLEKDCLADEAAISAIIDETLSSCASQCTDAIESNKEAAEAIALHTSLLKSAMDREEEPSDENSNQWNDISRVLEQKSRLQSESETLAQDARRELTKLEELMSQFKESKSSTIAKKVLQTEEICNEMRRELEESAKNVNVKLSESHVISQYKDLVDTAKEQFRQELLSVVPDVKLESGWRKLNQKLSHDDLNALIAHAHRRVDQLQRELAEERAIAVNRIAMAVKTAREKWEENASVEMERKIEVLKRDSDIEHEKRLQEVKQAFEEEMRVQLKRQAAAHSDHLTDVLGIQESQIKQELGVEFTQKLDEQEKKFSDEMENVKTNYEQEVQELCERFQFDLNKALAKVAGIETAVDGRAYIENETRKAQELWLACEALRIAVQYGDGGKPAPLQEEMQAIAQVPGVEPHVLGIVNALPEKACKRGVFTEDALRSAYAQVSKICRRVTLINETRNSFFDYIISYLKSLLIISRARNKPPDDLNVDKLDTFSILSYAAYCLENGDLEQATRFINQLTGEPRRIADGWLQEARLLLETRQIVEVLSGIASATSIAASMEM